MAKSSTVKTPSIGPKSLNHKQGAGQAAQGATDAIQSQHDRLPFSRNLDVEGQHPSTGSPLLHA